MHKMLTHEDSIKIVRDMVVRQKSKAHEYGIDGKFRVFWVKDAEIDGNTHAHIYFVTYTAIREYRQIVVRSLFRAFLGMFGFYSPITLNDAKAIYRQYRTMTNRDSVDADRYMQLTA